MESLVTVMVFWDAETIDSGGVTLHHTDELGYRELGSEELGSFCSWEGGIAPWIGVVWGETSWKRERRGERWSKSTERERRREV